VELVLALWRGCDGIWVHVKGDLMEGLELANEERLPPLERGHW
jgi:hypothetical protein